MGHTGRALAASLFTIFCCTVASHAQATTEETGNFVVGGTVIWVKATDAGVVQLFMSQGYRDAFARPIALPAASLRRWAESAETISIHQPTERNGSDSAEVSSGSLGETGMVLERWVAATGGGVRVERGGHVILHMPDDPGRNFIAAIAEAAKLTPEDSAPSSTPPAPHRAAPEERRVVAAHAAVPGVPVHLQAVTIAAAPSGAAETPRLKLRAPVMRAAALIPAPAARIDAAMHPAVVGMATAPPSASRVPSVRVKAPRVLHMALIPATRMTMAAAPAPVTAPSRTPHAPHPAMPATQPVAKLAAPPVGAPPASPAAALQAPSTAPAPPTPAEEDKHIRTPLGPFVIPAAAMRSRTSQVQYCYAQLGLRYDPDLTGSIAVRASLAAATDTVTNVEITGRTWSTDGVTAGEVEACVRTLIHDWRFEPSEIRQPDRTIELQFTFRPDQANKR